MVDIEKLLKEAEKGISSDNFWKDKITEEAQPFWDACIKHVQEGKSIKPWRVHKILEREYNVSVSDNAIRRYSERLLK